jgi:hypothetical protein
MSLIQHFGATTMQGENLERWQKLCAEAAGEQDPERLMQLVQEIDRMLSEKEQRLKGTLQTQKYGAA